VVRGPSALLAAAGGGIAYLLVAPALPDLGDGEAAVLVAGSIGLTLLGVLALCLVDLRDSAPLAGLLGLGAALLAAAMTVAEAGAVADVPKALFAAALGVVLARVLATPAVVLAVPLFVAAIDVWSASSGPTSRILEQGTGTVDFLVLAIPAWGGGEVGRLGISDVVFLAFFAALAWRYGMRRRVTGAAVVGALVVTLVVEVAIDRALPVLPFLAAALLVPNLDRLPGLLRAEAEEDSEG
jgi:hypothetical protein